MSVRSAKVVLTLATEPPMLNHISPPLVINLALKGKALGSRPQAVPLRSEIEAALGAGEKVVLDFNGVEATQSFVDELFGVLVLRDGPAVLSSVTFKRCSPNLKSIVNFVASDRARQHAHQRKNAIAVERHSFA